MRLSFALAALVSAFVTLAAAQLAAEVPAPVPIPRAEQEAGALIADRIEKIRAERLPNAPRLAPSDDLTSIARARSSAMARGAPFSHKDPEGKYPAIDMVQARFGHYGFIGENLFRERRPGGRFDPKAFAKLAVDEWMASDEHRENILSPDFDRSGIGVAVKGDYAYATQVFQGPAKRGP
jgi:uncharacterized protein YkwD